MTWRAFIRIALKTAILFALCNLVYALVNPLEAFARVSVYNSLVPGRARLPYGEDQTESYNVSVTNIPAMFAAHEISRPKAADEFRVVVIGDSSVWGWLLHHVETFPAQLEALGYTSAEGRRVEVYNLGYPGLNAFKDELLVREALRYQPDLFIWTFTMQSVSNEQQEPSIVLDNVVGAASLLDRTIIAQRRAIADWLRLQVYGIPWGATEIDFVIPPGVALHQEEVDANEEFQLHAGMSVVDEPAVTHALNTVLDLVGDIPLLMVNEPIFISSGRHRETRYNLYYARTAYDKYREVVASIVDAEAVPYVDAWDFIPAGEFTNTPLHYTAAGARLLAERIGVELERLGWVR